MIQIITRYGNLLLLAMGQTLLLALCGLFFACILGMFFGLLSVLKNKACRIISSIFVDVIRGVPMIVLAYFIYFGVPYCLNNMIGFNFTLTALQAGTVCLALNCGAYMAEIIRAGILSVDSGQMEAGRAVGLSFGTSMMKIVIPQAVKNILPALCNEFISLLKETSISGYIGLMDLTKGGDIIRSVTYEAFMPLIAVAVIYLLMVVGLSKAVGVLERKLRNNER